MTDTRLWMLAWLALCYAGLRLLEAYGLWRERTWAEWFAVISGSIYVPIEIYELLGRVTWVRVSALVINLGIVIYMIDALRRSGRPSSAGLG